MNLFKKYNSWVYSLNKFKFVLLIFITSILQTIALAILPSVIDKNYSNMKIKFFVILIVVTIFNMIGHLHSYKKYNEK